MSGIKRVFVCIIGIIFALAGVLLLINNFNINKTAVDVTATISRIDKKEQTEIENGSVKKKVEHDVYIDYAYEGQEFKDVALNYYHVGMNEGDALTVKIDTNNPSVCYGDTSMIFPCIAIVIGVVVFLVGLFVRGR